MEQLLNFLNGFVIRKRVDSKRHLQLVYFTDLGSRMAYKHTCSALAFGSIRVQRKCHFNTASWSNKKHDWRTEHNIFSIYSVLVLADGSILQDSAHKTESIHA